MCAPDITWPLIMGYYKDDESWIQMKTLGELKSDGYVWISIFGIPEDTSSNPKRFLNYLSSSWERIPFRGIV